MSRTTRATTTITSWQGRITAIRNTRRRSGRQKKGWGGLTRWKQDTGHEEYYESKQYKRKLERQDHDDNDKHEDKEKGMPIIVMKYDETKMKLARVVPKKGVDPYAVDRIKKDIEQMGYKNIIFKSDQEHSIKALKQAVT